MTFKTIIVIAIGLLAIAITLAPRSAAKAPEIIQEVTLPKVVEAKPLKPVLTHRQKVWIGALEWCESRAVNTAVNEVDLDGTASYYAFQFKPSTLRYYGEKYGVIEKGKTDAQIMELLKVYEIQKSIVEFMVVDPGIAWEKQFPGCVRLLGRPPKD